MYITYLKSGCHSDQHCNASPHFPLKTTGWIRQMRNQQLERLQAYSMGQHPTDMYVHQSKLQIQQCKDTTTTMYGKVNGWLTSFFYFVFRTMGTAFKFWAQKTASRGHSCRCAEFWAASDSLWLLAKITKEALHRGMYIPSSSNQCLDVLRIVNETHFSELSKLCCIELLRRHWNEIIIND